MKSGQQDEQELWLAWDAFASSEAVKARSRIRTGFVMFLDWLAAKTAIRLVAIEIESGECH